MAGKKKMCLLTTNTPHSQNLLFCLFELINFLIFFFLNKKRRHQTQKFQINWAALYFEFIKYFHFDDFLK